MYHGMYSPFGGGKMGGAGMGGKGYGGGVQGAGFGARGGADVAVGSRAQKLFVGQVPALCTEEMLQPLFQEFGTVLEVSIMRDKTGRSKGSAWVTYSDVSAAEKAVAALHDQHVIPPQTNPLQIKLADSPPKLQHQQQLPFRQQGFGGFGGVQTVPGAQHVLEQLAQLNKASGSHTHHPSRGGRKLFVGQIPRNFTQQQLEELMQPYGTIEESVVLQDRATGVGKGCAFVVYSNREEAELAVRELHGKMTVPPVTNPIQVSLAEGELEEAETKLFVGMVPYKATEDDIHSAFSPYGEIVEVALLKHPNGMSRGCAFVRMASHESADRARSALNGSKVLGETVAPLTVKFADSERERRKRQELKGRLQMMQYWC